jgi:hypothetical protein
MKNVDSILGSWIRSCYSPYLVYALQRNLTQLISADSYVYQVSGQDNNTYRKDTSIGKCLLVRKKGDNETHMYSQSMGQKW